MSYNPQVSRDGVTLRASTLALTDGTYDAAPTPLRMSNWNQLILMADMTKDAGTTSVEIKIQVASPTGDGTPASGDWYDLGAADISGAVLTTSTATFPIRAGIYTMLATGKLAIPVPFCYKWVRVAAKTTGAVGATTLAVFATQGLA